MATGKPIAIAILADASNAVAGMKDTGAAADRMGDDLKAADKVTRDVSGGLDSAGSASSTAAGGFGDLGAALALVPGPIGAVGAGMEAAAPVIMGVTGAADLAALAHSALKGSMLATGLASVKSAAMTVASTTANVASSAASKAAAAAQWLLNAALSANPIGLIIIGILLLVGAFVLAYKRSETFRKIVDAAFQGIKIAALFVFGFIKTYFVTVFTIYKTIFFAGIAGIKRIWAGILALPAKVVEFKNKVIAVFSGAITWLRDAGVRVITGLKNAIVGGYSKITGAIGAVKGKITGAISGAATWLLDTGAKIVQGLKDGVSNAWHVVTDKIDALLDLIPQKIRDFLGIKSPSKLMARIGEDVTKGLAKGIGNTSVLERTLKNVSGVIESGITASPSIGLAGGSVNGRGAGVGTVINVNIKTDPLTDQSRLAQTVVKAIKHYVDSTGRTVQVAP